MANLKNKEIPRRLVVPLKKHAGRDKTGRISVRHRGGGAKRKYRLITSLDRIEGHQAKVLEIQYDPNRSANIALVENPQGEKAYILAPEGLRPGDQIQYGEKVGYSIGNRMPLKSIPVGTQVHDIELVPGSKGKMARAAGTSATIQAHEGKYTQLKMPSGEIRLLHQNCLASIGVVSNPGHKLEKLKKAGQARHRGIRPTVRGKAMHPAAHPHGGGEGGSPIGLKHPKTPWGKPALGKKTRKKKPSDKFIIARRNQQKR